MKSSRWTLLLQNQVVTIVLAVLLLVPLLFAAPPAKRVDQMTAYGFLGLLLMVVWALRAQDRISPAKVRAFLLSGPNLPILLYAGWGLCSLLWAYDRHYGQIAAIQLLFGVLIYLMVVYQFRRREHVKALLSGLLAVGALSVLAAMAMAPGRMIDLSGFFHDRQLFGAFLSLILPLLIGIAAGTRKSTWKIAAQMASLLVAGGLLMTQCRTSILSAMVGLIVFGALSLIFALKWTGLRRWKHELLVTPILAIAVLAIFLVSVRSEGLVGARFGALLDPGSEASVVDRLDNWRVALNLTQARPLQGWGIGSYPLAQTQEFANKHSQSPNIIRQFGPSLTENPHNAYLQIAAEQGLIGLGLYLSILVLFFFTAARALPRLEKGLRMFTLIGAISALSAQTVDAISNPGWSFPEVSTFFWVVLGVGMCAAGLAQDSKEPAPAAADKNAPVLGMPRFLYRGLRTALIGCGALWIGAQLVNLDFASAAAAGGSNGNGKGHRPVYADFITHLELDFLNDSIPVPAAFDINAGATYSDRLAGFAVYACADDARFYANVTSETTHLKWTLHGLTGKWYYTNSSDIPRYYFTPDKGMEGRTGTVELAYQLVRPVETYRTRFTLTILPTRAPINESAGFDKGRNIFGLTTPDFLSTLMLQKYSASQDDTQDDKPAK